MTDIHLCTADLLAEVGRALATYAGQSSVHALDCLLWLARKAATRDGVQRLPVLLRHARTSGLIPADRHVSHLAIREAADRVEAYLRTHLVGTTR